MRNKKMTVRESKSILAKLLASENVTLIHDPKADTAAFDPQKRILYLPILENMNGHLYDWFIAHEVAHARWTPAERWLEIGEKKEVPLMFVNVTEDVRIERKIKELFPGTVRDQYLFYKELSSPERDFFQLEGKDPNSLTLIDRINLHFKIGTWIPIKFSKEEQKFVDMVDKQVTFEDAHDSAKAIYEYMKENNQYNEEDGMETNQGQGFQFVEGDGQGQDGEAMEGLKGKTSSSNVTGKVVSFHGDNNNKEMGIPEEWGKTQNNFDNSTEKLFDKKRANTTECGVIRQLGSEWKNFIIEYDEFQHRLPEPNGKYLEFASNIKPVVCKMVNQFNMRMAATDYSRIHENKTGVLDVQKLPFYKTRDDLFLSNTMVKESKNHGIIMLLDWSGSMSGSNIQSSIKQITVLMEFCKRVDIPFEVFAVADSGNTKGVIPQVSSEYFANGARLYKLFHSRMNKQQFTRVADTLLSGKGGTIAGMCGTPINSAAFLSEYLIDDFQARYNKEKVILCLLSDGGATDYNISSGYSHRNAIMQDRRTLKNYEASYPNFYNSIYEYVKDKTNVFKIIGFYITSSYHDDFLDMKDKTDRRKYQDDFNNKNYAEIKKPNKGFDSYFIININQFKPEAVNEGLNDIEAIGERIKNLPFMKFFIDLIV